MDMFLGIKLTLVVPEYNTSETELWFRKPMVRIRIHGSVPLISESGPDAAPFVSGFQDANKK
jgi:hypothetical protein